MSQVSQDSSFKFYQIRVRAAVEKPWEELRNLFILHLLSVINSEEDSYLLISNRDTSERAKNRSISLVSTFGSHLIRVVGSSWESKICYQKGKLNIDFAQLGPTHGSFSALFFFLAKSLLFRA